MDLLSIKVANMNIITRYADHNFRVIWALPGIYPVNVLHELKDQMLQMGKTTTAARNMWTTSFVN